MDAIRKFPRTPHIEGSRLQPGDEDMSAVAFADLRGAHLVIEEKLDGANAGLSFSEDGSLRLQSRGHYLTGGGRERHFALFKQWANSHRHRLREILGGRYLVYGEWMYAKHTMYYDALPHYFLEFDVFDKREQQYLDTERRHAMFADSPVVSVPVLWRGLARSRKHLQSLIGRSLYKTENWREHLRTEVLARGLSIERTVGETDPSDDMEGLYLKVEHNGQVSGRYKFVRASFLTSIASAGGHWQSRPIVPNRLADGVDIFS